MGVSSLLSGSGTYKENTGKLFFFPSRMQSSDDLSMVLSNLLRFSILPVHLTSSNFGSVEDVDALECTTGSKPVLSRVCAIVKVSA